jgi:hypothetical protein
VERIIAMTPDEADFNTKSIIGAHPNTYTFTYDRAENLFYFGLFKVYFYMLFASLLSIVMFHSFHIIVCAYYVLKLLPVSFHWPLLMLQQVHCGAHHVRGEEGAPLLHRAALHHWRREGLPGPRTMTALFLF